MKEKRLSPLKIVAAVLFILLAGYHAIGFIGNFVSTLTNLFDSRLYFMLVCSDLLSLSVSGLQALGFLLLGIACFMRKPRMLGIVGAVALIVALLLLGTRNILVHGIIYGSGLVQFRAVIKVLFNQPGRILRNLFSLYSLIYLIYLLLVGLSYVAAAVVLFLDKKSNKIMALVPSVLAVVAPLWHIVACAVLYLIEGFNFSNILDLFISSGLGLGLLIAAGFAMLCLSLGSKKSVAAEEAPEVIEEAEVAEEPAVVEEPAAE